jgi:hypothetical protein
MLAFIHIRKTGGSTVNTILRQSFGTRHFEVRLGKARSLHPVVTREEVRRCRWIYPRLASIAGHGVVPFGDLRELDGNMRFFTFLRQPLERCASDYQFRVQRGGLRQPFDEWINTGFARNRQTLKLAGVESATTAIGVLQDRVGFVGLLERFPESLIMWKKWCDTPALDIRFRRKNVAKQDTIKRQLLTDERSRAKLIAANEEDLRLYAHVVDRVFPRQIAEFGDGLDEAVQTFVDSNSPRPLYPRQLASMFVRELLYKPFSSAWHDADNPPLPTTRDMQAAA